MRAGHILIAMTAALSLAACTPAHSARPLSSRSSTMVSSIPIERPATAPNPAEALFGHHWVLSYIRVDKVAHDVTGTPTAAAFTLTFEPYKATTGGIGISDGECDSSEVAVTPTQIEFLQPWTNDLVIRPGCTDDPHDPNTRVVLEILSGRVTWTITGSSLSITHDIADRLTLIATT